MEINMKPGCTQTQRDIYIVSFNYYLINSLSLTVSSDICSSDIISDFQADGILITYKHGVFYEISLVPHLFYIHRKKTILKTAFYLKCSLNNDQLKKQNLFPKILYRIFILKYLHHLHLQRSNCLCFQSMCISLRVPSVFYVMRMDLKGKNMMAASKFKICGFFFQINFEQIIKEM